MIYAHVWRRPDDWDFFQYDCDVVMSSRMLRASPLSSPCNPISLMSWSTFIAQRSIVGSQLIIINGSCYYTTWRHALRSMHMKWWVGIAGAVSVCGWVEAWHSWSKMHRMKRLWLCKKSTSKIAFFPHQLSSQAFLACRLDCVNFGCYCLYRSLHARSYHQITSSDENSDDWMGETSDDDAGWVNRSSNVTEIMEIFNI